MDGVAKNTTTCIKKYFLSFKKKSSLWSSYLFHNAEFNIEQISTSIIIFAMRRIFGFDWKRFFMNTLIPCLVLKPGFVALLYFEIIAKCLDCNRIVIIETIMNCKSYLSYTRNTLKHDTWRIRNCVLMLIISNYVN